MYKTISIKKQYPKIGEFVTTIDKNGEHRVCKMNKDNSFTMRDADGVNSPNNNIEITHWLKKCDKDDFCEIASDYKEIESLRRKKQDLYNIRFQIIGILEGHIEIPEEEIFKVNKQLDDLSKYLDKNIKDIYSRILCFD